MRVEWTTRYQARDVPALRDETARMWSTHIGRAFASADLSRSTIYDRDADIEPGYYAANQTRYLRRAEMYWVSQDMGAILVAATDTMPVTKLYDSDIPFDSGFVVFEQPMEGLDTDGPDNKQLQIVALEWNRVTIQRIPCLRIGFYGSTHNMVDEVLAAQADLKRLYFMGSSSWEIGTSADDMGLYNNPAPQARDSFLEDRLLIHSFFFLIQQKIVRQDTQRASRQQARAAQRAQLPVPDVRILTLRETVVRDQEEATGGRHVEWQHRWIVSAHWRNQWRPSEGRHVPTLIAPYVKGPADRPLLQRPTVRAWRQ